MPLLHLKKEVSKDNLHLQWPNPSIFPLPSTGFTKSCSRATELLQQGQFNLETENTESGLLIYKCCLNYGSLGRRKVFEVLRGGGHPEKQRPGMCTEFCAGPAPVGSPVGTGCPHVSLHKFRKKNQNDTFWGNVSRAKLG